RSSRPGPPGPGRVRSSHAGNAAVGPPHLRPPSLVRRVCRLRPTLGTGSSHRSTARRVAYVDPGWAGLYRRRPGDPDRMAAPARIRPDPVDGDEPAVPIAAETGTWKNPGSHPIRGSNELEFARRPHRRTSGHPRPPRLRPGPGRLEP